MCFLEDERKWRHSLDPRGCWHGLGNKWMQKRYFVRAHMFPSVVFRGTDGFKYMSEMVSVLWSCCPRTSGMQYHVMKKILQQNES